MTFMRTNISSQRGVTLIELLMFIVVVSIALGALLQIFNSNVANSVDPVLRMKAVEAGQALLDEILSRRFDENTPTGGIPACGSTDGDVCAGIAADADYDDVGDYNGYSTSGSGYSLNVSVSNAGAHLGINPANARLITVVIDTTDGSSLTLAAYRVNF